MCLPATSRWVELRRAELRAPSWLANCLAGHAGCTRAHPSLCTPPLLHPTFAARRLPGPLQPWKDSSAAAIASSGLLRLGGLAGEPRCTTAGVCIVQALAQRYLARPAAPGPALASVLRNGSSWVPGGNYAMGLSWGDIFFLDALVLLPRLAEARAEGAHRHAPPPPPLRLPAMRTAEAARSTMRCDQCFPHEC